MSSKTDRIYAESQPNVVDFVFNEAVADVFPDMIRRSVPGYETITALLGVIAKQYAQPNTRVYDLGCSLGASTLAVYQQNMNQALQYHCVDNSASMIERCQASLYRHMPLADVHYHCDDMQNIPINQASLAVLNFTLQFIPLQQRDDFIKHIYDGLLLGGALVVAEKVCFDDVEQATQTELHHAFKRSNGYSDLEISQKRQALENVLIPESIEQHKKRLFAAGFESVTLWFQCFNFVALLAIKQ